MRTRRAQGNRTQRRVQVQRILRTPLAQATYLPRQVQMQHAAWAPALCTPCLAQEQRRLVLRTL